LPAVTQDGEEPSFTLTRVSRETPRSRRNLML